MSSKKKSVLAADNRKKTAGTTTAVAADGNKQTAAVESVLFTAEQSKAAPQAAVKTAAEYVDPWEEEEEMSPAEARKARAEYEAQQAAREAYRGIVREAYEDYRRSRAVFPEFMNRMESGRYDDLLTENDLVFQEYVKEEAEKAAKKNKRLEYQLKALTDPTAAN